MIRRLQRGRQSPAPDLKPEILRSIRVFENVNLENFGENDIDLLSFR